MSTNICTLPTIYGRAGDANAILEEALHDAKELRKDIAKAKELLKQQQESAAVSISELLLKASVTLADDSKPVNDRIEETHEIYCEAYALANESDYDREKYMELLSKYSDFLFFYAKYEECLNVDDELLRIKSSLYGENHITVANAYKVIGSIYESPLCDYDKALKYYEKHLEISVSVCGENDSDIASRCYEVGIFCYLHKKYDKALDFYKKSLKIYESSTGYNWSIMKISTSMGLAYMSLKKYDKAVKCFVNSLNIQLLLVRNENFIMTTTYSNIGEAYEFLGKYNKALEYYSKELNLRLRLLGDNHPDTKLIRDKIEIIRGETESL